MLKKLLILILFLLIIFNCKKETDNIKEITVTIIPQKYFVERITGNKFKINVMIPPGGNPHIYEPMPGQMKKLSDSVIYFGLGYIEFEKVWLNKFTDLNKKMLVVDTSVGIEPALAVHDPHETVDKGHEIGIDPHIWLSPKAVKIQVQNIFSAIAAFDPENYDYYKKNHDEFINEIIILDEKIDNALKNLDKRKFIAFHPSWTYFARDYNLIQIAVENEGKEIVAKDLKRIIDQAKNDCIKIIFVQEQFDVKSAKTIASEIDGNVIKLNPFAEDWIKNMEIILNSFKEALK